MHSGDRGFLRRRNLLTDVFYAVIDPRVRLS